MWRYNDYQLTEATPDKAWWTNESLNFHLESVLGLKWSILDTWLNYSRMCEAQLFIWYLNPQVADTKQVIKAIFSLPISLHQFCGSLVHTSLPVAGKDLNQESCVQV